MHAVSVYPYVRDTYFENVTFDSRTNSFEQVGSNSDHSSELLNQSPNALRIVCSRRSSYRVLCGCASLFVSTVGVSLLMGKTKLNAVTQALVHIDPDKHPLFIRLKKSGDFVWLEKADVDLLKSPDGLGLLCIVDDPNMFKETLDMAVLAPEIKKLFEGTLAAAWFTSPAIGRELATHLGIRRLPAVAVYCCGEMLGAIEGLRPWGEYQSELIAILTARAKPHKKTLAIAPVQN